MFTCEFDRCSVAEVVEVLLGVFANAACAIFWMSAPDSEGLLLCAGEIAGVKEYNPLELFEAMLVLLLREPGPDSID
jgi:hypothetical protein